MPRTQAPKVELDFRDPPPPKRADGTTWTGVLAPLLKVRNRWVMIKECDSPEQAQNARGNLVKRKVHIPQPDHDWGFAARGCELFAIYRGATHKKVVKRRTRKS